MTELKRLEILAETIGCKLEIKDGALCFSSDIGYWTIHLNFGKKTIDAYYMGSTPLNGVSKEFITKALYKIFFEDTLEPNRRNGMACKCNKDKFRDEFLGKLKESRRNIDNKLENPLFIAGYMESVDYLEDIFNYTWQEHMEEDDE